MMIPISARMRRALRDRLSLARFTVAREGG